MQYLKKLFSSFLNLFKKCKKKIKVPLKSKKKCFPRSFSLPIYYPALKLPDKICSNTLNYTLKETYTFNDSQLRWNKSATTQITCSSLKQANFLSVSLQHINLHTQEAITTDNHIDSMKVLVDKLKNLHPEFAIRDLQRKGWFGLKNANQCKAALKRLENLGYVKQITVVKDGKAMIRYLKV